MPASSLMSSRATNQFFSTRRVARALPMPDCGEVLVYPRYVYGRCDELIMMELTAAPVTMATRWAMVCTHFLDEQSK